MAKQADPPRIAAVFRDVLGFRRALDPAGRAPLLRRLGWVPKQEEQPVEGSGGKADHARIGMAQLQNEKNRASDGDRAQEMRRRPTRSGVASPRRKKGPHACLLTNPHTRASDDVAVSFAHILLEPD